MVDLAIVHDNATGLATLHKADCPEARRMAAAGHPVMTMFECVKVPDNYPKHSCLIPAPKNIAKV